MSRAAWAPNLDAELIGQPLSHWLLDPSSPTLDASTRMHALTMLLLLTGFEIVSCWLRCGVALASLFIWHSIKPGGYLCCDSLWHQCNRTSVSVHITARSSNIMHYVSASVRPGMFPCFTFSAGKVVNSIHGYAKLTLSTCGGLLCSEAQHQAHQAQRSCRLRRPFLHTWLQLLPGARAGPAGADAGAGILPRGPCARHLWVAVHTRPPLPIRAPPPPSLLLCSEMYQLASLAVS